MKCYVIMCNDQPVKTVITDEETLADGVMLITRVQDFQEKFNSIPYSENPEEDKGTIYDRTFHWHMIETPFTINIKS